MRGNDEIKVRVIYEGGDVGLSGRWLGDEKNTNKCIYTPFKGSYNY